MSKLTQSARLEAILNTRVDAACDEADSSCSVGYDSDGSECFDIFTNGFELAVRAGGKPVTYAVVETGQDDGPVVLFFIGTEEEACARAEELEEDEENDEEDEG